MIPSNVVIFPYLILNGKASLMPQEYIKEHFKLGWGYLLKNKQVLVQRENGKMDNENFYAYIYPKNLVEFETKKMMTPYLALGCQMTEETESFNYHNTKVYTLAFKPGINNLIESTYWVY